MALVFLLALVIRAIWVFAVAAHVPNALGGTLWGPHPAPHAPIGGTVSSDYNQVYEPGALGILEGKGFVDTQGRPTAYVGPLYSVFVAAHYSVFGVKLEPIRITQVLMESVLCVFVLLLGQMLIDARTGFIAGLLYAFYPPSFYEPGLVLTETLFTFLLILGTLLFVRGIVRQDSDTKAMAKASILFGILIGLASLTRPNALTYPLGAVLALFVLLPDRRQVVKLTVIMAISMGLVVMPWVIRNYLLFDKFIPISDIVYHTYLEDDGSVQKNLLEWMLKKADRLINHTGEVLLYAVSAPLTVWFKTSEGAKDLYVAAIQLPVLALAILGLKLRWSSDIKTRISALLVAVFVISLLVATKNALARYVIPVMPLLFPYVAFALVAGYQRFTAGKR